MLPGDLASDRLDGPRNYLFDVLTSEVPDTVSSKKQAQGMELRLHALASGTSTSAALPEATSNRIFIPLLLSVAMVPSFHQPSLTLPYPSQMPDHGISFKAQS
jgi:hypothetical protein